MQLMKKPKYNLGFFDDIFGGFDSMFKPISLDSEIYQPLLSVPDFTGVKMKKIEGGKQYIVLTPGCAKEDVSISLRDKFMVVKWKDKVYDTGQNMSEFAVGDINEKDIEAKVEHGVTYITINDNIKEEKKIKIK